MSSPSNEGYLPSFQATNTMHQSMVNCLIMTLLKSGPAPKALHLVAVLAFYIFVVAAAFLVLAPNKFKAQKKLQKVREKEIG